jgi:hypothetical protein
MGSMPGGAVAALYCCTILPGEANDPCRLPPVVRVKVRAKAVRWASDDFPGWIEAAVLDIRRQEHRIVDKVPVLTPLTITHDSPFPVEFWIDAVMAGINGDQVVVSFSDGVQTTGGAHELVVSTADVIWL